ncbi:hypothetical protein HZC00_05120 [Candidatus Kaiserbacteria bacterium]|nr:hypothetical protein [Candidatus Kaiserbacteria bacterium]
MTKKSMALCSLLMFSLVPTSHVQANHLLPPNKVPPTVKYADETLKAAECLRRLHLIEGTWNQWLDGDVHFTRVSHSRDEDTVMWEIGINAKARAGKLPGIDPKEIDVCMKELDPLP